MNRSRILWVSIFASMLLTACGGDRGLTVMGSVAVTDGEALSTGFPFNQETNLDDPGSIPTGTCEVRRNVDDTGAVQWGVVAVLNGTVREGRGLSSITVMGNTADAASGRVEAQLGTTAYTSDDRECEIVVEYLHHSQVSIRGGCDIADANGEDAHAEIDLEYVGCNVVN
jgi:hypothetical protein